MTAIVTSQAGDEVEHLSLDLPATTEHLRLVRLLVTSVATSHGADLDDLEDLRIAAGEIGAHAVGAAGTDTRMVVRVGIRHDGADGAARLEVRIALAGGRTIDPLDELGGMVLGASADDHGVTAPPAPPEVWFVRTLRPSVARDAADD
jgi:serine/threonine-protein kinase RsbW